MLRLSAQAIALLQFLLLLVGCAASPPQTESLDYRARAETQSDGGVRVSAVVLSPEETVDTFSMPLAQKGIQPVWVEIDNQEEEEFAPMLLSIDPDYFTPSEIAWRFRGQGEMSFDDMMAFFLKRHIAVLIQPHSTVAGYVYTNLDSGAKAFAVELIGERDLRSFEFFQVVPVFEADFMQVDFHQLYEPDEIQDLDLEGLREYLEKLPCCVLGGDNETPGDPLNLVLVGEGRHVLATLVGFCAISGTRQSGLHSASGCSKSTMRMLDMSTTRSSRAGKLG